MVHALAWSEAKAETENKKSLRAAALFLLWIKAKSKRRSFPPAVSNCNLLYMMAPVVASNGNNIKLEEWHEKQQKIYRKFANEFVLFYPSTLFTGRQLFSIVSFMLGKATKPIVYDRNCFLLTRLSDAARKTR